MQKLAVKLLCEDSRNGSEGYVFEELVVWLLCDRLGCDPWDPRIRGRIQAVPRNGASNVKKDCALERNFRDALHVVALYDEDKIHQLFPSGCRKQIAQHAVLQSPFTAQLTVVLLRRNLETVLELICAHVDIDPVVRAQAIERKRLNERDLILKRAIGTTSAARSVREHLVAAARLGSERATPEGPLRYLVARLLGHLVPG